MTREEKIEFEVFKADWLGTTMHCYAAMSFVNEAGVALAKAQEAGK